jgi:hypothetical protein
MKTAATSRSKLVLYFWVALVTPCSAFAQQPPDADELGEITIVDRGRENRQPVPAPSPNTSPRPAATDGLRSPPESQVTTGWESRRPSNASAPTKGLFMAAFAPVAADVVARGLSGLLSKLVDSLFSQPRRTSEASGDAAALDPRPAIPGARLAQLATAEKTFGSGSTIAPGLAVRVLLLDNNDTPRQQLPTQGATVYTAQAVVVELTSNVPGLLSVDNLTPDNRRQMLVGPTFITSGSTNNLPGPGRVFYFKGQPGRDRLIFNFTACRASDPAERAGYATVASLAATKDIGTRPARGGEVASNLRLEDMDAERGLTQPAVFNRLEGCSSKDIGVRPARVGSMDDGTTLFTDPKEVSLNSAGSIGGTIQGLIEFNHVGR